MILQQLQLQNFKISQIQIIDMHEKWSEEQTHTQNSKLCLSKIHDYNQYT